MFEKEQDLLIEQAISCITDLFRNDSGGHDAEHTLRVYHNAMRIAETEPGCDREITALAALLHDADDHKLFHTENNKNARAFLEGRVPAERVDRICACINSVSFSQNLGRVPEPLEGKIVQDADRLDAMGAIGIARTFAYGGEHGRPVKESVQHFHDKLLLLKDMMNTETAKQLAAGRHAFLKAFLSELDEERMAMNEVKSYIPYYDEHGRCWRVDFPDRPSEEGDLLYVASEFARTGLYFPYNDSSTKEKDYNGHAHYFEGVLRALLDDPEGFSIEGFEEYYSLQEREMLTEVQEHLLRSQNQV